jgi:hypothetical protein
LKKEDLPMCCQHALDDGEATAHIVVRTLREAADHLDHLPSANKLRHVASLMEQRYELDTVLNPNR